MHFIYYLFNASFNGSPLWKIPKGKFLKFKFADHFKIPFFFFFWIFFGILEFYGSFEKNLTRKIHKTFFYACL